MRQLLQSALCTAKAGEVASIKEQQDTMAQRSRAQPTLRIRGLAFPCPSPRTHEDGRNATGRPTSRTDSTPSWHSWGKWQ